MKKFEQLFKGSGFLTKDGEQFLHPFSIVLENLLKSPEVQTMTISQIRTLTSSLLKKVGDSSLDLILKNKLGMK